MSVHEESLNAAEEFGVFLKWCPVYRCLYDAGLAGCIYNSVSDLLCDLG